jgi:predicted alpha/beta hydrolase family esterase
MPTVLILPGRDNSGPQHWQSLWEAQHPAYRRVQQKDWAHPSRDAWVGALERALAETGDDVILVGHSAGAMTIALWAQTSTRTIRGAMLVAPPDMDAHRPVPDPAGMAPVPLGKFNFPSILVASSNDWACSIERAEQFARAWGSRFVNIGPHGHLNVDAGFGPWPEGEKLLQELIEAK